MIRFLNDLEVLLILQNQIDLYGGMYGVRDVNLLNSAIATVEATFENEYLHRSIPEMAAAYCYHICKNHPFMDGNKRTALATALVFIELNNYCLVCSEEQLYNVVAKVAKSEIAKKELIEFFEKNCYKK